ncbi:MAG: hypothetical protein NW224_20435 [Leptolyngbyaceae cyanobacterium bins.302]|nr:hypothetical protein [Leptolyngbyaceae cyanobacterium bins.302]
MHYPGLVITTTAIVLGASGVALGQEAASASASSQTIQTSTQTSNQAPTTVQPVVVAPVAAPIATDSTPQKVASQPVTASVSETAGQSATNSEIELKRFSDTTIDPEFASPAASLGGTLAADAKSMASNCPLKTEMLAMTPEQIAQASPGPCPRPAAIDPLIIPEPYKAEASPALSIYIPVGYGLDGWSVWGSGGFQAGVREDTGSVGAGGVGVGLGDAKKYVGLELGYTFIDSDDFGEGGFSGKLHRRFPADISVAFGWNGFANIGRNDFEQSIYGVATKIFRLSDSLDKPFSRISLTVGAGNGQFRSNVDRDKFQNGTNVFGNLAFRIIRPVSLIAEWTGQDLALGLSIAPFRNLPFVITPAFRDVTGSGYEPRFVLGAGVSFKF